MGGMGPMGMNNMDDFKFNPENHEDDGTVDEFKRFLINRNNKWMPKF